MIDVYCPAHGLQLLTSEEYYGQLENTGAWECPVPLCDLQCRYPGDSLAVSPRIDVNAARGLETGDKRKSTMNDVQAEETNGKAKEPSLVSVIRAEWIAAGSPEPAKAALKPFLDTLRAAEKAVANAQLTIASAKEASYAASLKLAKLTGCTAIKFDGARHEFSSREGKVFLRVKGDSAETIDME